MYSLKIKVREKWNIYNEKTKKLKIKLYFYSQNYYREKGKFFFIGSGIIEGSVTKRNKFLSELKKDKKVVHLESNEDFFTCTYCEKKTGFRTEAVKIAYNPRIIFIKPVIIDEEGWEEWEIASTRREDLEAFIHHAEKLKNVESKLFYLKNKKVHNLMIYSILPKLTDKQKSALILAVENGYYGYPRKISLMNLARQMNISTSTYQFHLAKAEAKLIPFLAKKY